MKVKAVYKFINSYTNESFISVCRFNTEKEAHNYLTTRFSWQKWEIIRIEIEE